MYINNIQYKLVNTYYNFYSDSNGRDPDKYSPTLRHYHKILWSKQLPNGHYFQLDDKKPSYYLFHESELGQFSLGSDSISHSYKNQKRKQWLIRQVPEQAQELYDACSTIGSYALFPNKKVNGFQTINQSRGVNKWIDDRFDLTLECIRRFYIDEYSPLYATLLSYKDFFSLFSDFEGYVNFFLLNDLIENQSVKFYLPFDDFKSPPVFTNVNEYLLYKENVMKFIKARSLRIEKYCDGLVNLDHPKHL